MAEDTAPKPTPKEQAMAFVHDLRAGQVVDPNRLADVLEALVGGGKE